MKRLLLALILLVPPATSEIRPGHRLPEGSYHSVREREIDIEDYAADLRFDMELRRSGIALRLAPDLQRCQRPFHRQVHDHCGASLCGGLKRKAGRGRYSSASWTFSAWTPA